MSLSLSFKLRLVGKHKFGGFGKESKTPQKTYLNRHHLDFFHPVSAGGPYCSNEVVRPGILGILGFQIAFVGPSLARYTCMDFRNLTPTCLQDRTEKSILNLSTVTKLSRSWVLMSLTLKFTSFTLVSWDPDNFCQFLLSYLLLPLKHGFSLELMILDGKTWRSASRRN